MGQPSGFGHSESGRAGNRFLGRSLEQRELHRAFAAARAHARTVYVQGPEGVGKSCLLEEFSRALERGGVKAIRISGEDTDPQPGNLLRSIGEQLDIGVRALADTMAEINRLAATRGLLLCVDACEGIAACHDWLRAEVLGRLGPGALGVLAGRRSPFFLWPKDPLWRAEVQEIRLGPFSHSEAEEFLEQFSLGGRELVNECLALSGGMPGLLRLMADALVARRLHVGTESIRHFLIEQLLHPGSRRDSVRLGDLAHISAALAGNVGPDLLAAMLGPGAPHRRGYRLLEGSPYHHSADGRVSLPTNLRVRLAHATLHRRPWTARTLVRRALRHLDLTGQGSTNDCCRRQIWAQAAHLMLCAHLVSQEEPRLRLGPAPSTGQWPKAWQEALLVATDPRVADPAVQVAYDAGGAAAGMSVSFAWDGAAEPPGWPRPTTAGVLRRAARDWNGLLLHSQWLRADAQPEAAPLLLLHALDDFARSPVIVFLDPTPALHPLLDEMGFRADADGRHWVLEHAAFDVQSWLSSHAAPPRAPAMTPEERLQAAREALLDLRQGAYSASLGSVAAVYGTNLTGARTILIDALQSADLGSHPVAGGKLLRLYYVERAGTHEALAEELGVSRATYFRCHQRALRRLGDALFT